jgi:hypothetical protein
MNERIIDHCFVPQKVDQLKDECAYPECSKPEIEHEWTVEAYRRNPDPPVESQERKLLIAAYDALRSYQYGNASTELAEEIANAIGLYFSGGKE